MKINITFKYLPRSGKFQRTENGKTKYYVLYNSKGDIHNLANKSINWRLPKFIWTRL